MGLLWSLSLQNSDCLISRPIWQRRNDQSLIYKFIAILIIARLLTHSFYFFLLIKRAE